MKRCIVSISVCATLMFLVSSVVVAQATVHNPTWIEVVVKNPDGVKSETAFYDFNERCKVPEGTPLEKIRVVGELVLVRYGGPRRRSFSSCCPIGTVFWMEKWKYESAEVEYQKMIPEREAEKKLINLVLREYMIKNKPNP